MLLTTQQGLERRAGSSPFHAIEAFLYRGTPRAVRVWDEALEIAAPITLRWSAIAGLADVAMRRAPEFAEAVHALAELVRTRQAGDPVTFPDFQAGHGISWREIKPPSRKATMTSSRPHRRFGCSTGPRPGSTGRTN